MTGDETRRFLDLAREQEPRYWSLFITAIYTGLRKGELLGLRRTNVNL